MNQQHELPKTYAPAEFEERIYKNWCEKGYFTPVIDRKKPSYTIVIPPPNITGQLHMGHALDETLQDILIRYKRMCGYCTLWLPGTDHASIATEAKIVEAMRKEGLTKDMIGREAFLKRAWAWKEQYGGRIVSQLKRMGSSCDWSRERFTMDEGCSRAVKEVFVRLYEKGLIYRGERIINWCPKCRTSISDAEVEYEEQAGHFWHIRYPFTDGSGYLELATTRPETLLGDTAVAVNPNDDRYKDAVGKTLTLPLVGREIPVVADDYVETDFGTGVVKITPAHDPNDFEVGRRHALPVINVLTEDARIVDDYPKYAGMDRYEARKAIVKDLEEGGYLIRVENYAHNVGTCYRCHSTVEPRVSLQWFVKMEELAAPAIAAVREGRTKFVPERFEKNYFHWMENIRDWCISRQLWWGHRIPAFYCDDCGELTVTKESEAVCPKCGKKMRQDPDTLDTWFSSALWPFSTLGWPDKTEDLDYFYPTSTLVTGYDIITFWVSRMIFSGLAYMGKEPFDTVLIHGLVRDAQGRKMSKSLGNGIDPLQIIDTYGADALRFALATGNSPGNDMRFSDEKIEAARNFANKLWNASRFVRMNLTVEKFTLPAADKLAAEDKWILTEYQRVITAVRGALDRYEIGIALSALYDFVWDVFCDWYIELAKARLAEKGTEGNLIAQNVIGTVLCGTLKLLHPFMPFITEEIYGALPHSEESIMIAEYPSADPSLIFEEAAADIERVIAAIRAIRTRRNEMNVAPSRKAKIYIATRYAQSFAPAAVFFSRLAGASEVEVAENFDGAAIKAEDAVQIVTDSATILLPLSDLVDTEKERARLCAEVERLEKETEALALETLMRGKYDDHDAVLSLHAGAGGTEAQDWTQMLYRMYVRYCERMGFTVKLLDLLDGDEAGIKSVTFEVTGDHAYGYLRGEKGVHRLVRISPFDSNARRHTSFASLDVAPILEDDDSEIEIDMKYVRVDTYHSSGAGGQNVNKTSSAVRMTYIKDDVTIVVSCQTERDQVQNRATCIKMLKARLLELREREKEQEMADIKGEMKKIEWGSQIRSYVFQPYTMVKDHRTGYESGNIDDVMNGNLEGFTTAYLKMQ